MVMEYTQWLFLSLKRKSLKKLKIDLKKDFPRRHKEPPGHIGSIGKYGYDHIIQYSKAAIRSF